MAKLSRRNLLWATGTAGVALAGGIGVSRAFAEDAIPDSVRFDLTTDAIRTEFFEEKLPSGTVMQGFAFHDELGHVYTGQVQDGAVGGPGDHNHQGDLVITRLGMSGGVQKTMLLNGFGHAAAVGIEPAADGVHLWVEGDCQAGGDFGFGRVITRVKLRSNTTVDFADLPAAAVFAPVPGMTAVTASVDMTHGRIALKYKVGGRIKFSVYDLEAFKARDLTPLSTVDMPAVIAAGDVYWQGFTLFGRYLYTLEGNNWGQAGSTYPDGNTYLTCVDAVTGEIRQRAITRAAKFFDYREPEGMGVHLSTPGDPTSAVLYFGLASGSGGNRRATLYTKPAFA